MAEHPAATQRLFPLALVLGVAGGYADAASYVLTRSFTGHITGNSVLFAVHLAAGEWSGALRCALAVAAFLAGISVAELTEMGGGAGLTPTAPHDLRWPLVLETALLAGAVGCRGGWSGAYGATACVVLASAALGVQNGALRRCRGVSVHTTFLTGMATSLVTSTVRRSTGHANRETQEKDPIGTVAAVWGVFVLGAAFGAVLTSRYEVWGFAGILVPVGIAAWWSCLG